MQEKIYNLIWSDDETLDKANTIFPGKYEACEHNNRCLRFQKIELPTVYQDQLKFDDYWMHKGMKYIRMHLAGDLLDILKARLRRSTHAGCYHILPPAKIRSGVNSERKDTILKEIFKIESVLKNEKVLKKGKDTFIENKKKLLESYYQEYQTLVDNDDRLSLVCGYNEDGYHGETEI